MFWIYDIPTWVLFLFIVGGFCALGVGGLLLTHRQVAWVTGEPPNHNEGVDVFIGAVGVLYGLIAGLIAVAVWEQYATVDARVSQEAAAMGALYRDAAAFPEPTRTQLRDAIRSVTFDTMTRGWDLQRRGETPTKTNPALNSVVDRVYGFEPSNAREADVQQSAMAEFGKIYELRRQRLHDASAGLPAALYAVILIGGALTIILTYFLALERFRLHIVMTLFTSAMIGLVVFMIVAMDHPFRGEVSIGPDAFAEAHDVLMRAPSER